MALSDQDTTALRGLNAKIQAILQADPTLMAAARSAGSDPKVGANPAYRVLSQGLAAHGINLPAGLVWNQSKLQAEPDTSFLSGKAGVIAGLVGAATLGVGSAIAAGYGAASAGGGAAADVGAATTVPEAAGALSGVGAAPLAGSVAAGAAPLAATVTAPATGALVAGGAGVTPAAVGAGAAVTGGLFKNVILPNAISAGENLAGAAIASNAAKSAAATQSASADKAIALQNSALQQEQAFNAQQLALAQGRSQPYINAGQGALSRLGQGTSQPVTNPGAYSMPSGGGGALSGLGAAPAGYYGQTTAAPAVPQGGAMITVQAPTGQTKQVPASEAQHWTFLGAKVIG